MNKKDAMIFMLLLTPFCVFGQEFSVDSIFIDSIVESNMADTSTKLVIRHTGESQLQLDSIVWHSDDIPIFLLTGKPVSHSEFCYCSTSTLECYPEIIPYTFMHGDSLVFNRIDVHSAPLYSGLDLFFVDWKVRPVNSILSFHFDNATIKNVQIIGFGHKAIPQHNAVNRPIIGRNSAFGCVLSNSGNILMNGRVVTPAGPRQNATVGSHRINRLLLF